MTRKKVKIRECLEIEELVDCVKLQRKVFALPEVEISPVRHFIVTSHAGGFTLGAFIEDKLVGFVLSVLAYKGNEKFFYSHMTAVDFEYQNYGIGSKLKWSQRDEALKRNVDFIKWTFQPVQARNAFLNLEKLGAFVKEYHPNFYGTDYGTSPEQSEKIGIDSDRLFAEWHLKSEKVEMLAKGQSFEEKGEVSEEIEIPNDWNALITSNHKKAVEIQSKIKEQFQKAFAEGLVARGFQRDEKHPRYLLYKK